MLQRDLCVQARAVSVSAPDRPLATWLQLRVSTPVCSGIAITRCSGACVAETGTKTWRLQRVTFGDGQAATKLIQNTMALPAPLDSVSLSSCFTRMARM